MPSWLRPCEGDQDDVYAVRNIIACVKSVVGLFPLCGFAIHGLPAGGALAIVLFVLMWEISLWRVVMVGVYVSDYGIKVRMVHRTRVLPWSRVTRAWVGQAANHDAWQIWISARNPERDFETPIWRRGTRAHHRNRIVLPPEDFAAVLAALNSRR